MKNLKSILLQIFPFLKRFFKADVAPAVVTAPPVVSPAPVATSLPTPAPAPIVSVPSVPVGPILGPATLSLTGPITGNGGVVGGPQPGPFSPTQPIDSHVMDINGTPYSVSKGVNVFDVPVKPGHLLITSAEFSDPVQGTLSNGAGVVIATSPVTNGKLYLYCAPREADTYHLVIQTETDNPQAHVERQGDA